MAFFDAKQLGIKQNNTRHDSECSTLAVECAKYLAHHLAKQRALTRQPNMGKWALEFEQLLQCQTAIEVRQTLKWFVANRGNRFTPIANSAKTFCDKYNAIRAAMHRAAPDIKDIQPSATARQIYDDLKLYWPEEAGITKQQVLALIEVCYSRYATWYAALRAASQEQPTTTDNKAARQQRLLAALAQQFPTPEGHTAQWLLGIHRYLWSRGNWEGGVMRLAWHTKHHLHRLEGERFCLEYCCDKNRWQEIERMLDVFIHQRSSA